VECETMGIDAKPKKTAKFLRKLGGEKIAAEGHQPHLGTLLAWLIGSKRAQIDMAKAGMAHLVCEEPRKGSATLIWLVTPEWLAE